MDLTNQQIDKCNLIDCLKPTLKHDVANRAPFSNWPQCYSRNLILGRIFTVFYEWRLYWPLISCSHLLCLPDTCSSLPSAFSLLPHPSVLEFACWLLLQPLLLYTPPARLMDLLFLHQLQMKLMKEGALMQKPTPSTLPSPPHPSCIAVLLNDINVARSSVNLRMSCGV